MPAKKSKPAAKKPAAKPAKKAPSKAAGKKKPGSKPAPAKKPAPKKPSPKPVKKAPAKPAPKKAPAKKPAAKPAAKKPAPAKKPAATAKKAPAKPVKTAKAVSKPAPKVVDKKPAPPAKAAKAAPVKAAAPILPKGRTPVATRTRGSIEDEGATIEIAKGPVKMTPFLKKQKQRLVELRDAYLNSIEGVAAETIRGGGVDASAFGMHQADAGSDAYDRDFALSLLGKEQDALYEINEALKRIETGTYGICEGTGQKIPEERLEAMPFARFSVTWQEKIEREQRRGGWNRPVHSLFGLDDPGDASDDDKDEDEAPASSSNNNSGESLDFSKE
ncbi:MAG: TraR/DksA C4-type zinc finger protein [Verrucomicrobiaceae bacterium]|nr:TraR/DksA C4-type zinc finger protein [Verrucomicrobiaceae bacterium]